VIVKGDLDYDFPIALSRLGLSIAEFLEITPGEFYEALHDRNKRDLNIAEATSLPIASAIRLQTWWQVNIQLPPNKKIKRPEQFMTLPGDEQVSKEPQTKEDMVAMMKLIAAATKGKKKISKHPNAKRIPWDKEKA
jgi:hypothetical protein